MTDEAAIIDAAKATGAWPIIEKLKYGLDTELRAPHLWDAMIPKKLLLKRVQRYDEWEEKEEQRDDESEDGESGQEREDRDDETEDEKRTDAELLQLHTQYSYVEPDPAEMFSLTAIAAAKALPAPDPKEAEKLSDNYDAHKLNDNDSEESARFSRGEWAVSQPPTQQNPFRMH